MENNRKIIPIACDHAGYEMKEFLKKELQKMSYEVKDYGTFSTESVDYPDMVHPLGRDINNGVYERGIVLCGSGQGVQITVNKYPNVRCAVCWMNDLAVLARKHNDANVISLPARFISNDLGLSIVNHFLTTEFEGGRHQKRVEKINKLLS